MNRSKHSLSHSSEGIPSSRMAKLARRHVVWILAGLILVTILACGGPGTPELAASVVITSPAAGSAFTVGQEFEVKVSATDPKGITQVELWVDGKIVTTASTPDGQPQTNVIAVLAWAPDGVGIRKLQARSVNSKQETTTSASVEIAVQQGAEPLPTATSVVTLVPVPPTSTLMPTSMPAPTPQSCTPMVIVQAKALNVRSGPGTTYSTLGRLEMEETAEVTGRNAEGTWWQIKFGTAVGWVSASYVSPSCTNNVPIVGQPTPAPTVTPAADVNFWADNTTINPGQCTNIRWQAINVKAVYLNEGGADQGVAGQGNKTVCPTTTTTYRLIVILSNNQRIERQLTINVQGQGISINLRADNTKLKEGECTILRWDVDGAKSVYISDGKQEGGVSAHGSAQICPKETVTYRLRAIRWDNYEERRELQIKVEKGPGTINFWADRLDINKGECTTLHWQVTSARRVFLNQGQGEQQVGSDGSLQVCPASTNSYTLRVEWQNGQQSQDGLTITVHQNEPPPVVQFSANPQTIHIGESSTLVWSVQNGKNIYLDGGSVPAQGSQEVSPQQERTYVLRVVGLDGSSSEYKVTINIILAINTPVISINANPTEIVGRECSVLTWSASHGNEFYINNESVAQNGSQTVCPTQTTDYTFRVSTLGAVDAYQTVRINVRQPEPTDTPTPPFIPEPEPTDIPQPEPTFIPQPEPTDIIIGPGGLPPSEDSEEPLIMPR